MAKKLPKDLLERLLPVLLVLVLLLAGLVGYLFNEVNSLKKGGRTSVATDDTTGTTAQRAVNGKLSEEQAKKLPSVSEDDHVRGSRDAQVFIVEYSDLECPFCQRFHPTAQQALDEYEGQVAWVYRHFPLDSIHPRARAAAEASECVAELGGNDAFWSFVDGVFEDQQANLTDSGLRSVATSVGVNGSSYDACVAEGRYEDKVEDHYQTGSQAGVTGTPGNFIVNSKGDVWYIPGAVPFSSLKQTIDEALSS